MPGSSFRPRTNDPGELQEHLSESELRVLRFLPQQPLCPGNLGGAVRLHEHSKDHMRHIYAKLGVHGRGKAVSRARELRLLPPVATLRR